MIHLAVPTGCGLHLVVLKRPIPSNEQVMNVANARHADDSQTREPQTPSRLFWTLGLVGGLAIGGMLGKLAGSATLGQTQVDSPFSTDFERTAAYDRTTELELAESESFAMPGSLQTLDSSQSLALSPVPADLSSTSPATAESSDAVVVRPVDGQLDTGKPNPLFAPVEAAPIAKGTVKPTPPQRYSPLLESLLESELPNANEAERGVWTDVLSGLPLDDAREIIHMRKRLSSSPIVGPLSSRSKASALPKAETKNTREDRFASTFAAFDKAASVLRHNIANAEGIGFLPGQPMLTEAASGVGAEFLMERIDFDAWSTFETGRSADIAPTRGTFLAVESDDGPRLTTMGRTVRDGGFVAIDFGPRKARVLPLVEIDEETALAEAVRQVRLWSVDAPGRLKRIGQGQFAANEESGDAVVAEGEVATGVLAVGDVDVDQQKHGLSLLEARRVLLQNQ